MRTGIAQLFDSHSFLPHCTCDENDDDGCVVVNCSHLSPPQKYGMAGNIVAPLCNSLVAPQTEINN